jgi:mono/diheme cytochrome c family protein
MMLVVAFAAAGCGAVGRVTEGDASHGKQLFVQPAKASEPSCGSCHTLADANTKGTIGPNLDDAFSSDKSQHFSEQTIKDVVRGQIAYPEPPMPANLYSGQDADDVATYIAKCSGNPKCGVTPTRSSPHSAKPGPSTTTTPSSAAPDGKQIFASAGCNGCHTLKDAGASGTVGPNLDQLKPSEAAVEKQVTNGGGAMPAFKGQLTPAQIKAVAEYVSSVAGK